MGVQLDIAPLSGPLCVLAADDDAVNRLMLQSALELFGATSTVVSDGAQAVEIWRRGGFDVVLLDIEMPGMGGGDALEAIRSAERASGAAHAPAIAFSGHDAVEARSYERGFDFHLRKPVILSQLRETLQAACDLRQAASPAVRRAS